MTDTIENLNNDIDLQLAEMMEELRAEQMNRATEMAFEVEIFEKVA